MSHASASRRTSAFRTTIDPAIAAVAGRTLFRLIPGSQIFAWVIAFSVLVNSLLVVVPFYTIQVFDRVITSGSIDTLLGLTVLTLAALGFSACFDIIRYRLLSRYAVGFEQQIAPLVLRASIYDPARSAESGAHDMVRLRELKNFISGGTITTLVDAPFIPLFVLVLYYIHPVFGWIAVSGGVILLLLAILSGRVARREMTRASGAASRAQQSLDTIVRHPNLIRAMGWTSGAIGEFLRLNDQALAPAVRASERIALIAAIGRLLRVVLQVLAIGAGAWLVLQNEVFTGSMMASSIMISRTLAPMEHLVSGLQSLVSARDAWSQLSSVIAPVLGMRRRTHLPPPSGTLGLEGVGMRAQGTNRLVLKGIDFCCLPAKVVIISGPTGAGKSTLLRLIAGLDRPSHGVVRLDGASLSDWDPDQLGRYVGYLPQDVELFGDTVADAIAGFEETATDDDVIAAAKYANAHEMILSLPKGYETEIGRDGVRLSGGQRQRIALARALFGDRRLILLDEPNSNLDPEGEEALCSAINDARARGLTLVIVTHRVRLFAVADHLLFLRNGVQVAFGHPSEVLPRTIGTVAPLRRGSVSSTQPKPLSVEGRL